MAKSLIFCFDGTLNYFKENKQDIEWFDASDKSRDKSISNILKLHILFGGNFKNQSSNDFQHSFYYSGLANHSTHLERIFNATFEPVNLSVKDILNQAMHDVKENYTPTDKIFVFGFSRGAAIARRFCAIVHKALGYDSATENIIEFIGVYDTIASIGKENLDDDTKPISDVVFENGSISKNIKSALHILSIDETRVAFQPTLMNAQNKVKEVWFSGVHSDIGGGFLYDGLSDITLAYMIEEIKKRQLDIEIRSLLDIDFNELKTEEYAITKKHLELHKNACDKLHIKEPSIFSQDTHASRQVSVNEEDMPSQKRIPIIYQSVQQRFVKMSDYRPSSLDGLAFYLEKGNHYIQIDDLYACCND